MKTKWLQIPIYEKTDQEYSLNINLPDLRSYTFVGAHLVARVSPYITKSGEIDPEESHIYLTYGERLRCPLPPMEVLELLNDGIPLDKN